MKKLKPSLLPQDIDKASWYYEGKGSIDLICYPNDATIGKAGAKRGTFKSIASDNVVHVRIPSSMLLATLKRQGKIK